jgi:heptosyltransferase III
MSRTAPKSVLIVCLRYLGDTLLLRPAFRSLRTAFPGARLDALVTSRTGVALDDCADVSNVLEWPKSLPGQAALLAKVSSTRYDWVIDFTGNDRSALIALLSGASLRAVYDRPKFSKWSIRRIAYNQLVPPKKKKPHILIQRQELLEACNVPGLGVDIGLVPRAEALAWADEAAQGLPPGWLHAHVTSRDMAKAIPVPVARAFFQGIIAGGDAVVLTSGPAAIERDYIAQCVKDLPTDRIKTFSDLTWHQLVALISRGKKYWGADTAPSHIAAALRKPMLIHYGPSKAEHWKPLHEEGLADVRPQLQEIDPTQLLKWWKEGAL